MHTLYRYHVKGPTTGEVGNEVAGFESFNHALDQVEAWSKQGWTYWIDPQKGIDLPRNIADSYNDLVLYSAEPGTGKEVASAKIHHKNSSVERWRHLFELHGYDEEFDEQRLAPELGPSGEVRFEMPLTQSEEGALASEEYLLFDVELKDGSAPETVCRLDRSAISPNDWTTLIWMNSNEGAAVFIEQIDAPLVPVDEGVDASLLEKSTVLNVRPGEGVTLQRLRALDTVRDRDLESQKTIKASPEATNKNGGSEEEYQLFDVKRKDGSTPDVVCRLDRSAISPKDWSKLLWMKYKVQADAFVQWIDVPLVPVDEGVDVSLLDKTTIHNVRPAGDMTVWKLRALNKARSRDQEPEQDSGFGF